MQNELFMLLMYSITGLVIGIIFNIFRLTRKIFKMPDYIVYIQDIIFWIITGILLIFLIYVKSGGSIRIYYIFGLLLGCFSPIVTIIKRKNCHIEENNIKKKKIVKN